MWRKSCHWSPWNPWNPPNDCERLAIRRVGEPHVNLWQRLDGPTPEVRRPSWGSGESSTWCIKQESNSSLLQCCFSCLLIRVCGVLFTHANEALKCERSGSELVIVVERFYRLKSGYIPRWVVETKPELKNDSKITYCRFKEDFTRMSQSQELSTGQFLSVRLQ